MVASGLCGLTPPPRDSSCFILCHLAKAVLESNRKFYEHALRFPNFLDSLRRNPWKAMMNLWKVPGVGSSRFFKNEEQVNGTYIAFSAFLAYKKKKPSFYHREQGKREVFYHVYSEARKQEMWEVRIHR